MLAKAFRNRGVVRALMCPVEARAFTATSAEIKKLEMELKRKMNAMKMYGEDFEFTYERPRMIYDKATGDVTILAKEEKAKRAILRSVDDAEKEKKALFEELGLEGGDPESDAALANVADTAGKIAAAHPILLNDYDVDPTQFHAFSRDMFRIDIGLIINRPPIFMHMRQKDIDFVKLR